MPLFTSGRARPLDNPRLVSQFAALERRTSPLGKDRVDHGRGGHDDLCNAAALAMVLASGMGSFDMTMWLRAYGGLPTLEEERIARLAREEEVRRLTEERQRARKQLKQEEE